MHSRTAGVKINQSQSPRGKRQMDDLPPPPPDAISWDYDAAKVLGKGGYGMVFRGEFNGLDVAVKRIDKVEFKTNKTATERDREEAAMMQLDHPNVLKLFFVDSDSYFRFFILELCEATIADHWVGKYLGPMLPDADVLYQMTQGLSYIHSKGFVHRDVKADNVLIFASPKLQNVVQLKISDFGLSKPVTTSGTYSLSGHKGTRHFYPPELLKLIDEENTNGVIQEKGNVSSDVFALGCLFYGCLTKGKHPFSDGRPSYFIPVNILEGKYKLNQLKPNQAWAYQIIAGMILSDPNQRWTLAKVEKALVPVASNPFKDSH